MNATAQDIDSGTGETVTHGEPVDHVDSEDGQSVGHTAEPEGEIHEPGQIVSEKPSGMSRDEIYNKASDLRDAETAEAVSHMSPTERAHYERMIREASGEGGDAEDPFDGEGQVREDWQDPHAPPAEPSAPAPEATAPAPEPTTAAPQPAAPAPEPAIDTSAETVTITVYGMKQDVPKAEVDAAGGIANYQKNLAADERMRRLSTYEASLRRKESELQERETNLLANPPAAESELPPTGAPDESVDVQAAAEKLVGAMYTGDRDAAITQAAEVLGGFQESVTRTVQAQAVQPSTPSQSAPDAEESRRIAQQTAERNEANRVFVEEFEDLHTDVLKNATYQMVQQVSAEPLMYGRPLAEITREAGLRVRRDVFGASEPPPPPEPSPEPTPTPPPPGQDLADRMALKSRTVVSPLIPARGKYTDQPSGEQTFESRSEYVARMKRDQRGQM